jgi:hypothetical protein
MEREFIQGPTEEPARAAPTRSRAEARGQRSSRLLVGRADDPAEREADRIADRVVAGLRRHRSTFDADRDGSCVRRAVQGDATEVGPDGGAVGVDVEQSLRRTRGRGEPLDAPTLGSMEASFGVGLGDVRIHRDSAIAPRLGATAFTLGSDIHFAPGHFAPSTDRGQWLLGHELAHVVQQRGAGSSSVGRFSRIRRNGDLLDELEAFTTQLKELSDLTSLRVRLVPWDGQDTETIAKRYGVERFVQLVSAVGDSAVVQAGTALFLAADPADPYALRGVPLDKRVKVAKAWKLTAEQHASGLARAAATEGLDGAAVVTAMTSAGATAVQLARAWIDQVRPTLAGAKPWLLATPQTSRDAVYADKSIMAKAKAVLVLDDYLGLLPLLQVLEKPTARGVADPWGSFDTQTLGPMVDNVIRTHLAAYVGGAVAGGKKAEGQMSVVNNEDWEMAFKRQWKKVALQPYITGANAFVDVNQPERHIWIHKDRGGPGTAIHEGIHKYANPHLRDEIINRRKGGGADVCNLDEGLTELFTRKIIAAGKLGYARSSYVNQHAVCELLDSKLKTDVLAKAYFDGAFDALKLEFATKTKNSWDTFEAALETNNWAGAKALI